jgi:hypothetical protein
MATIGPAPKPKPYHMAKLVDADGNVSPLCADSFRPINLQRGLWTNRAEAVTCPKCRRRLAAQSEKSN